MDKNKVNPSFQMLLGPLALFVVMLVLYGVVIKISLGQISKQRDALDLGKRNVNTLEQKLMLLQEVQENILPQADRTLAAVPDRNPALMVMFQLKEEALVNSVALEELRSGASSADRIGVPKVTLTFTATGSIFEITNFLNSISTFAPISLIEKVNLNEVSGVVKAEISVKSYWMQLPTKLPSLTEPISQLSASDLELLSRVSLLRQPVFIEVEPTAPTFRPNPF